MTSAPKTVVVAALYRFTALSDFESLRDPLYNIMLAHEVRGTLLLAEEGINGTIAGSRHGIDGSYPGCARIPGSMILKPRNPPYQRYRFTVPR